MTHWIITSSLLILAVLLIRLVGRDRLSAGLRYALWGLVLLRLLMPFSLGESVLSLQNYLPQETRQTQISETYVPSETTQTTQTGGTIQMPQTPQISVTEGEKTHYVNYPMLIWTVGAVLVGGVFLVSNLRFGARLRRSRKEVMHRFVPIYECAAVETPCLFGFLQPAVYVTPEVMADELALRHVLAHELTHYRHLDHIWSMLRCICMTLHWYNPLVWVAAYLSQQDAELACDEGTLRRLGEHERTAYAKTLLDLTCVGYRGMLTTATSMTGSESDLKTRVLRIVKNPKMPLAVGVAVLIVAAIAAVSVFTGAMSPKIEGVWRVEMSYLGGDTEGPASAYMEYEFYDTRGVRTMIVGDEIRSAEWFIYSENPANGLLELSMLDTEEVEVETFAWEVTEDTLTLVQDRRELVLTRVERETPPYLPEGVRDIYNLRQVPADDDTVLVAELNGTEQAQLLHLLWSGTVAETRKEVASNQGHPMYEFTVNTRSGYTHLSVAGGLVYDTDKNTGYVVSNIDEIVAWLEAREWRDARAYSVYGISVEPEPVEGAVNIAWGLPARSNYMVPADQTAWREAVDAAKAKGVPDGADMTIIERMEFGLYADGQHWYFDTDGTAYIAGAELYIAPEGTDTIMQLLQPYVDIVSPDTGDTLPYAGTTHYILWEGRDGNVLKFVDGDFMQRLGDLLRAGAEELPDVQRGIEWREGCYKLFGNQLGIDGYEIMISDLGELVIDWDTHYTLSNADEVWALLERKMETIGSGFVPADIHGIASAVMVLEGRRFAADEARLGFLEELLSEAEPLGYLAGCPFNGTIELSLEDGRILSLTPALDSCAVFKIGEEYYEYGNKYETPDGASYGNEELLDIFGLDEKTIMDLYFVVEEAENTEQPVGDVVRVRSGQSDLAPVTMTDETRETLFALLTEGIYEPVEENAEVTCKEYAYEILCGGDYGFPDLITVSDNGSVYMDGLRFEPENYAELLTLLEKGFAAKDTMTPDEKLAAAAEKVLHFNKDYPITAELLAKAELGDRKFALVGSMNDVFDYYLIEYTEIAGTFRVTAWDDAVAAPPEISGYWPNYAVMGGTYLCWSRIPEERSATTPDGKAFDMNAEGFAVNDYTAIRFRMKNGSTIDAPIPKGAGTRLMLQMFDGEWPVSSVPMVGKTEVTICEMTFDYVTTGYPAGSLGEVIDESDLKAAVQVAKADYEAWRDEEWCLSMEVLDAAVNDAESERLRAMYENFEEGWTLEYLAENFVVVRVTYKCELDHNKIFYPDGTIEKDTLLIRDNAAADWEIWDYSAEVSVDPPDGRGESEVS